MTPTPAEESDVSNTRSDIVRDASAASLLILGMLYHWNFTDKGTDLWYVVVSTLTATGGLGLTLLARSGAMGSSWNVGYDRLVRIAAAAPWIVAFIVLFVVDIVDGGKVSYGEVTLDLGSVPSQSGGIGSGALIGLAGILIAMQPRDRERFTDESTTEDRIWFRLAGGFGVAAIIALLATSVSDLDTGLAVLTVLLVMVLALLLVLVAVPVFGLLRRDPGWTNVVIGLSAAMVLMSILTFGSSSGSAVLGLVATTDGETVHNGFFCMTFLIAAGAAAAAPGTRRLIGRLTDQPTLRITASRVLLLLALVEGVVAVLLVFAIYQADKTGATIDASIYLTLIVTIAIAVTCGAGSADLLRGPDRHLLATVGAGVYAGGAILVAVINAIAGNPAAGTGAWLTPVVISAAVIALIFGPRGALHKVQTAASRFRVSDPSSPAVQPAPSSPNVVADTPPPLPGSEAPPSLNEPGAVEPEDSPRSHHYVEEATTPKTTSAPPFEPPAPALGRGAPDASFLPKLPPIPAATSDRSQSGQSWGGLGESTPPPPPPPPPVDPIREKATDPRTTPAELAALAENHPHVRPEIAAHPQAYPDLLVWLSRLGDPAVNDALGRRAP